MKNIFQPFISIFSIFSIFSKNVTLSELFQLIFNLQSEFSAVFSIFSIFSLFQHFQFFSFFSVFLCASFCFSLMSTRPKHKYAGKRKRADEGPPSGADLAVVELPISAESKKRNTTVGQYDDQILFWESQKKMPKEIALLLQQVYTLDPKVFSPKAVSNRLSYLKVKGHRLTPLDTNRNLSGLFFNSNYCFSLSFL